MVSRRRGSRGKESDEIIAYGSGHSLRSAQPVAASAKGFKTADFQRVCENDDCCLPTGIGKVKIQLIRDTRGRLSRLVAWLRAETRERERGWLVIERSLRAALTGWLVCNDEEEVSQGSTCEYLPPFFFFFSTKTRQTPTSLYFLLPPLRQSNATCALPPVCGRASSVDSGTP